MLVDIVDDRPPEWPRGQTYHVGPDGRRDSSADGWDDYKRALGWGESMYGDPKTREAMEKILRPPKNTGLGRLNGGRGFSYPSMRPEYAWSSWTNLAEQIAAGASPLQLIVAPGGVDRTGI